MNCLFLLEDEKSSSIVLPCWLDIINFPCKKIEKITDFTENNYLIQNAQGILNFKNKITDVLSDIENTGINLDWFIIMLDSDDNTVESQKAMIQDIINSYATNHSISCAIKIVVADCCFETWLLGNRCLYPKSDDGMSDWVAAHYNHYNIKNNDPALMDKPSGFIKSKAKYHTQYLHDIALHNHLVYRKSNPKCAKSPEYFHALESRIQTTDHISTFKEFYDFIKSLI